MLLLKIVKHIFKYLKGTMDQEMYRREMTMWLKILHIG
jgi:hypothetical protein